jgi:hypothetical protein
MPLQLSGQDRCPHVEADEEGIGGNEHTRCPALTTTSRLSSPSVCTRSTVSSRLRDRRERGVMGDRVRMRGPKCGKHMGGEGLVCG